jgi:uncharacterized protein YjbI with pentapeptide repeats
MIYIQSETFSRKNFANVHLDKGQYEECIFEQCIFSEADLSFVTFIDCEFLDCNLSLARIDHTSFQNIRFEGCKMLGLRFSDCNAFAVSFYFDRCILDHASFYKLKIKKTIFKNCQLHEADFAQADLSASVFDSCDLRQAIFEYTNLEAADLRTALYFSIDPETNRVAKAKFSLLGLSGLLHKYKIVVEG